MGVQPIIARHVGALIALSMAAFAYVTTETLPIGLSCVAVLTMLAVAWLLPTTKPGEGEASRGTAPDARRYWLTIVVATAGTSIAVNIGITAGALIGGLLLSQFGVRSTALAGGLLSIAALAAVSGEFLLRSHPASPEPEPAVLAAQHT